MHYDSPFLVLNDNYSPQIERNYIRVDRRARYIKLASDVGA
jgi:hypothetical protein